MSYKDKLEELYVDEEKIMTEVFERIKPLIGISKGGGEIIFNIPLENLTNHQKILIYMIGAYFAHELGEREEKEVTIDELEIFLKKKRNVVRARLSELRMKNKIKLTGEGKNILNPLSILEDIDDILKKMKWFRRKLHQRLTIVRFLIKQQRPVFNKQNFQNTAKRNNI